MLRNFHSLQEFILFFVKEKKIVRNVYLGMRQSSKTASLKNKTCTRTAIHTNSSAPTAHDGHVLVVLQYHLVVLIQVEHGDGGELCGDTACFGC